MTRSRHIPHVLAAVIAVIVVYAGLSGPHILHGDGREYILQTQALVFDHALRIDTEARREYWNHTNPHGITLQEADPPAATPSTALTESSQAGGGFGGLYPDRFGHYRYYHFWAYSAVVAPVYALFHALNPSGQLEYFSFRFVNVCLLLGFFLLAYLQKPRWPTLVILGLLLCSPLIPYCDWQHPELFCLTLVFLAFHLATRPAAFVIAPLFLGLAASMNLPLLLFFPCHLFVALRHREPTPAAVNARLILAYAIGAVAGLSSSLYFLYCFGTPNVISHIGLASLANASFTRVADIFFSPLIGAVFFYPLAFLALPACWSRKNALTLALLLATLVAAAWLSTATANFNAGQVGTVRYAVWLLAPLWWFVFRFMPERFSLTARGGLLAVALGLNLFLVLWMRTYEMVDKDIRKFGGAWRAQPEVAALLRAIPYVGDVEVVVENILGKELAHGGLFKDVYVWDLGRNRHLWIVSERAIARQRPLFFQSDTAGPVTFTASPPQPVLVHMQGNIGRLALADLRYRLHHHPILGGYVALWSQGPITAIGRSRRLEIRSDTIAMVDALDSGWKDD